MKHKKIPQILMLVFIALTGLFKNRYNKAQKEADAEYERAEKLLEYYNVLNHWLQLKHKKKTLASYFEKEGYQTIAIYGMKELGERLYDELCDSGIEVKYGIDQNADKIYAAVEVYTLEDELETVDVIVVTASYYYEQIEQKIKEKTGMKVVNLEDIIFSM